MGFEKDEVSMFFYVFSVFSEDILLMFNNENNLFLCFKIFVNVFMVMVGVGVFGFFYMFKKMGWLMGILMMFFVGFFIYYCMMFFVYICCWFEIYFKFVKIFFFGDLGFVVCGFIGWFVVDVMILLF